MPIEMMGLTPVSGMPGGVRETDYLHQLQQASDRVARLAAMLAELEEQDRKREQRVQQLLDKAWQWLNSAS